MNELKHERLSRRWLTYSCFVLAAVFSVAGCTQPASRNEAQARPAERFHFPSAWTELSASEWREMELGENRTLITIMDPNRAAGFSVIRVPVDSAMKPVLQAGGDDRETRATMAVESIHAAGPEEYEDYKLIRKGTASYAGRAVGEIVYQGQNPGKGLRWFRVLVDVGETPGEPLLMLVHSAPLGQQESFAPDFGYIETTWQW